MPQRTVRERFDEKWEMGPVPAHAPELGPCHIWTGAVSSNGYGNFWMGKPHGYRGAHMSAWLLDGRPAPSPGRKLDHRCHRELCVRLSHLRDVTDQQNSQHRKGAQSDSLSGLRGVSPTRGGRWYVRVVVKGKCYYGGTFDDPQEAAKEARAIRRRVMTGSDRDLMD